uniref:Ovule protein n=1 Tax=Heterorhabditis bacteriophora TaxID=37862 RepID=A0A1I7XCM5_HETBA
MSGRKGMQHLRAIEFGTYRYSALVLSERVFIISSCIVHFNEFLLKRVDTFDHTCIIHLSSCVYKAFPP